MIKIIKKTFTFYALYIHPLIGVWFIGLGLFTLYSTYATESLCVQTIATCATSAVDQFMSGAFILFGVIVLLFWYIDTYAPYRNKKNDFKSSLKPEDFVK